jgi:hypothetical protein
MQTKKQIWLRGLVAAVVTGISSSVLSALGIAGAEAVGVQVTALDAKQLSGVAVAGGLVGLFAYLKQSPVPPADE